MGDTIKCINKFSSEIKNWFPVHCLLNVKTMNRLFIIFCLMASVRATKPVAIKLVDIEVLTFKKNHQTTTAKSLDFPQLKCYGQNCKHAPDVVQCVNVGIDD